MASHGVVFALLLGALMHHGVFIRGEWHLQASAIVGGHVFSLLLLLVRQHFLNRPLGEITAPSAAYVVGLLASISLYRIFFHRLRAFPGPRLAALSKLWHVWKCRDSRGHHVLESWRKQYGTFVRTGEDRGIQTWTQDPGA
jgi:hypothetical protein